MRRHNKQRALVLAAGHAIFGPNVMREFASINGVKERVTARSFSWNGDMRFLGFPPEARFSTEVSISDHYKQLRHYEAED